MNTIKSIAVYCGSSKGFDPEYAEKAYQIGRAIADKGWKLIFGGGHVGLMGASANGALDAGGEVIGVIPGFLEDRELGHPKVTELITVKDMHERKAMIEKLSDAFIALPGGIGTLEELSEMMTWGQLGLHAKPIGILNTKGFYTSLQDFLKNMVDAGFLRDLQLKQLLSDEDPVELLNKIEGFEVAYKAKWM